MAWPTGLPPSRVVPPIVHYSAPEPFTKYEMCLVFARILGVPHTHIVADAEPPKVRPGEAARGPSRVARGGRSSTSDR